MPNHKVRFARFGGIWDTVAEINSLLISNIHNQLYAQDALFNYMRGPKDGISSGATLWQDNVFLAAGQPKDEKIVALRAK